MNVFFLLGLLKYMKYFVNIVLYDVLLLLLYLIITCILNAEYSLLIKMYNIYI